jgi:hypothetical protein
VPGDESYHTTTFESLEELLNRVSPAYREQFSQQLADKLSALADAGANP